MSPPCAYEAVGREPAATSLRSGGTLINATMIEDWETPTSTTGASVPNGPMVTKQRIPTTNNLINLTMIEDWKTPTSNIGASAPDGPTTTKQ